MRDVDDVEDAERDRHSERHGGIEPAEQNAGDQGVDQQIEAQAHLFPPKPLSGQDMLMRAGEPVLLACQCAGRVPPWLVRLTAPPGGDVRLPVTSRTLPPLTLRPAAARLRVATSACWRFAGIRWS